VSKRASVQVKSKSKASQKHLTRLTRYLKHEIAGKRIERHRKNQAQKQKLDSRLRRNDTLYEILKKQSNLPEKKSGILELKLCKYYIENYALYVFTKCFN